MKGQAAQRIKIITEYAAALGFAVITYLFFTLNVNVRESNFIVPLAVRIAPGFASVSEIPPTVQVTVRGNPAALSRISGDTMSASVDFSATAEEAALSAPVQLQRYGVFAQTEGVEVVVSPAQIAVQLERSITHTLPVKPAFINSLPRGYTFEQVRVIPETVRVAGPRSALENLASISTTDIDVSAVTQSASITAGLRIPGSLVRLDDIASVVVDVSVSQSVSVRNFEQLVPEVRNVGEGLTAAPPSETVRVTVQGGLLFIDEYTPVVFVDASQYRGPGVYEARVMVDAVDGLEVISVDPQVVSLFVQRAPRGRQSQNTAVPLSIPAVPAPAKAATPTVAEAASSDAAAAVPPNVQPDTQSVASPSEAPHVLSTAPSAASSNGPEAGSGSLVIRSDSAAQ